MAYSLSVKPPLAYRLFTRLITASHAVCEDDTGLAARAVRAAVVQGVGILQRLRSLDFPESATGGWYWVWRWKLEFLMYWFEWESLVWARRLVKPGMTVLDLGAHVGYYSRLFSQLVGPRGKVLAFEANPENVAVLRRNLGARRYANVEILPYAVSNRAGTATLFVSAGHSNHSLIEGFSKAEKSLVIETVTVDAFLERRGISAVDFVKIDIEGAESLALEGMRETIRRSPQLYLLMECNPLALEKAGTTREAFLELIASLGFRSAAILEDATLGSVPDPGDAGIYVNLLCWNGADPAGCTS